MRFQQDQDRNGNTSDSLPQIRVRKVTIHRGIRLSVRGCTPFHDSSNLQRVRCQTSHTHSLHPDKLLVVHAVIRVIISEQSLVRYGVKVWWVKAIKQGKASNYDNLSNECGKVCCNSKCQSASPYCALRVWGCQSFLP